MSRLFMSLWLAVCALVVAPLVGAQNQGDYTGGYVSYAIPYSGACQNARGMAVDSSGYMYVCCGNNPANGVNGFIIKMDASGNFVQNITITQNGVNVPYSPFGIAFSGSSMYVTSLYTNMIYVLSTSGYAVTNSWNTYLNWPWGIAVDSSSNVWVANYGAGNVLKFTSSGTWQTNFSTTNPALYYPEEIAIDSSGNVLVVDTDNNRIVKFNSGGSVIATFNNATTNPSLVEPGGIALDSQGSIYVCDTWNYAVIKLNSAGQQVEVLASPLISNGGAKVSAAAGLTIDSSNQVYVVDSISNNRILKFPATLFNNTNGQSATAAASGLALAAAAAVTLALL